MTQPLHLKYRPQSFESMVGQRLNAVVLAQMVKTGQVPAAVMFSGPSGVGKTSAARILAKELEASDVIELDAASNGGVAEVRKVLDVVRYSSGGSRRVIIFDEAQSITRQGFEALLKTLEEGAPDTHFVLVTTEPYKIPDPILSRVTEFQFRAITPSDVLQRLAVVAVEERIEVEEELLRLIANRADGNMRSALQDLDKAWRAEIKTAKGFLELSGDADPAPALLAAVATGNHAKIFGVLDTQLATVGSPGQITAQLVALIRDLFVLQAGGDLRAGGQGAEVRAQMARRIDRERLFLAVRVLWDVKTKLRAVEDPQGSLEMALILIAEAFKSSSSAPSVPTVVHSEKPDAAESPKMTLADIQKRR